MRKQGVKTDNVQRGAAEQKQAPGGLRGPDGFTPQESSPTNGGINVRSTTGQGPAASAAKLLAEQRSKIVRRTSLRSIRSGGLRYIQIADEILIIDPGTREIVEIFQI